MHDWEQRKLGEISNKINEKNIDNSISNVLTNSATRGIVEQNKYFDKDIANSKNITGYYIVHVHDFVYNPRISNSAPYGPIKQNLIKTGIMSPLYYCFRILDGYNTDFLSYLFDSSVWHRFMFQNGNTGARSDRFAIKDSTFAKMNLNIPSIEEQKKIATLFSSIIRTINLQQRKLDQLNTLQKALLEKMFADKSHPQPELRFKEFSGDWEQRKLGEVVKRVIRKNKDNQSKLPLTISAQDGLIAQNTFFGKNVASKNLENYILLKRGEFAYNKSYSNGYPYGSIKRLNKYDLGVISSLYIAFKPNNINSTFLEHYYDSEKWYREIYSRAAEGARNHGLLNISPHDFFDANIYFPTTLEEQQLVGQLIDKVSITITLQQRKIDKLQLLKKSLLQNMFVN